MLTPDGTKYRIRYSSLRMIDDFYDPRYRKNCLVTIQKEDYVFFGIARCKLSVDRFVKKEGHRIALERAQEACQLDPLASFFLNSEGTLGYTHVRFVKTLLKHFESLDTKE